MNAADFTQAALTSNTAAVNAYLNACPPTRLKQAAMGLAGGGRLDSTALALDLLAGDYVRQGDAHVGVTLAEAAYSLCRDAHSRSPSPIYLSTAASAAAHWVRGLRELGRHCESAELASTVVPWIEQQGGEVLPLLHAQAEGHLELSEFEQAEAALARSSSLLRPDRPGDATRLRDLSRRLQDKARTQVTGLPPAQKSERDQIIEARRQMMRDLRSLGAAIPEDADMINRFADALEAEVEKDVPGSLAEHAARLQAPKPIPDYLKDVLPEAVAAGPQSLMERLGEFVGGGGMNQLQNQARIRQASGLFLEPARGHDPKALAEAAVVFEQARDWARAQRLHGRREQRAVEAVPLPQSNGERRRGAGRPSHAAGQPGGSPPADRRPHGTGRGVPGVPAAVGCVRLGGPPRRPARRGVRRRRSVQGAGLGGRPHATKRTARGGRGVHPGRGLGGQVARRRGRSLPDVPGGGARDVRGARRPGRVVARDTSATRPGDPAAVGRVGRPDGLGPVAGTDFKGGACPRTCRSGWPRS